MLWKIVISWPTRERISWVVATKVFPLDGRKHRCAEAELTPLSPLSFPFQKMGCAAGWTAKKIGFKKYSLFLLPK